MPVPSAGDVRSRRPASVLYVTYDGLLEPLGASQVLPYLRGLAGRGFSMEVLSFEKPGDLAATERVRDLDASMARWGVRWSVKTYHKRPSLPATAFDVWTGRRHVAAWARAHRRAGTRGVVHTRGYPPGVMGLAAQRYGAKLLFDMRGFWVDERIEGGYWAPGSAAVRIGRLAERRLLTRADHLILLTRRAGGRLAGLAGGATGAWTVVPTCVDLQRFRPPADAAEVRRALGLGAGPVLIHVGTLTGWYDGGATMEVARAFLAATGGRFVILTRDVEEAGTLVRDAGLEATVRSAQPAEVPRWLQAADAGLALVRVSPSKDASYPTKVAEYLASGLAVLGTPVGDMRDLADDGVVRLLEPGSSAGEAAAWLARASAAPDRARRARALAEADLGVEDGVDKLAEVYGGLGVTPEAAP